MLRDGSYPKENERRQHHLNSLLVESEDAAEDMWMMVVVTEGKSEAEAQGGGLSVARWCLLLQL